MNDHLKRDITETENFEKLKHRGRPLHLDDSNMERTPSNNSN